jgi:hypothetical protein
MSGAVADFKVELSPEWRALQTQKWRLPKWVKLPRTMLEDMRWINLSDRAKAAWPSILLIASENSSLRLPEPELLYRRLHVLGVSPRRDSFSALIRELIQCGFLLNTTPELQSYRELQKVRKKKRKILERGTEGRRGWARKRGKKNPHNRPPLNFPSTPSTFRARHFRETARSPMMSCRPWNDWSRQGGGGWHDKTFPGSAQQVSEPMDGICRPQISIAARGQLRAGA